MLIIYTIGSKIRKKNTKMTFYSTSSFINISFHEEMFIYLCHSYIYMRKQLLWKENLFGSDSTTSNSKSKKSIYTWGIWNLLYVTRIVLLALSELIVTLLLYQHHHLFYETQRNGNKNEKGMKTVWNRKPANQHN